MSEQTVETLQAGDVANGSAWLVTGASVQGLSHQRLDLPCQDAHGYRVLDGNVLLAALADGAGSAEFSDAGAQAAVAEMLRALEEGLKDQSLPRELAEWENLLCESFKAAREAVLELADRAGELPRAFAATLTGLIATADGLVVGQIGDGAVIAEDGDGAFIPASHLQRGEYANETHFLVEEDALDQVVIERLERPVRSLAVMSDGLIRLALKMPDQEPHAPFFEPLFRFASTIEDAGQAAGQLADFLASERVNARTDDDKSLILAVLRPVHRGEA